jgi:hypothetical protein
MIEVVVTIASDNNDGGNMKSHGEWYENDNMNKICKIK